MTRGEKARVLIMVANLFLFLLAICGSDWCLTVWFASYPAAFACAVISAKNRVVRS